MSLIIPPGTRIYLTKRRPCTFNDGYNSLNNKSNYSDIFYIQPNTNLLNDSLYVAYDVKINGIIVIPRGSKVIGNWITGPYPIINAQLQLTQIIINGYLLNINANSEIIVGISCYNNCETNNAANLYRLRDYHSPSNIVRRVVNTNCRIKALTDVNLNTPYLEIYVKELPVTLTRAFEI